MNPIVQKLNRFADDPKGSYYLVVKNRSIDIRQKNRYSTSLGRLIEKQSGYNNSLSMVLDVLKSLPNGSLNGISQNFAKRFNLAVDDYNQKKTSKVSLEHICLKVPISSVPFFKVDSLELQCNWIEYGLCRDYTIPCMRWFEKGFETQYECYGVSFNLCLQFDEERIYLAQPLFPKILQKRKTFLINSKKISLIHFNNLMPSILFNYFLFNTTKYKYGEPYQVVFKNEFTKIYPNYTFQYHEHKVDCEQIDCKIDLNEKEIATLHKFYAFFMHAANICGLDDFEYTSDKHSLTAQDFDDIELIKTKIKPVLSNDFVLRAVKDFFTQFFYDVKILRQKLKQISVWARAKSARN